MHRRLRPNLVGRLRLSSLLAALLVSLPAAAAPPLPRPGATLRLLDAGSVDGHPRIGLEIALDPGWKTYWRAAGDAGVPPVVDWSRSTGVAGFDLRFPAPVRFGEAGTWSIGYTAPVILPIDLVLADPARPAVLDLDVQIGICHDICVPVSAHLAATVAPDAPADPRLAARLAAAEAAVPKPAEPGVAPWVLGLRRDPAGGAVLVDVKVPVDPATVRDVLVEGPTPDWALPLPVRVAGSAGHDVWRFDLDGVPPGATLAGSQLRFTLRTGDRVVEQKVSLDAAVASP